jgi:LacI family transcriptional regulator
MAARLKDIARDLGVSVVTVSKVLRDHPDISAETKDRVLKRMKELNYRPNLAARALVTGRTFIIGLVVPDLVHPFFAQIARGLSRELRKNGYNLVISSSEEDPELEQQEIDQLLSRRVDALVIASAQWTVESFRRIEEQKTPYVLIDRKFVGLPANFVGVDDELVGVVATEHLIQVGCTRIAHIGGPLVSTAIGRVEGYRRALRQHQMDPPENCIITLDRGDEASDESGYEAMRTLLSLSAPPDGVFCYNDPTAMGAMKAIIEAGCRIPQDIAIVACGNVHYAEFLKVPLTSVDQASEQIGERAAGLVLSLISSKGNARPKTVLLEPRLVVRDSSRRTPVNVDFAGAHGISPVGSE